TVEEAVLSVKMEMREPGHGKDVQIYFMPPTLPRAIAAFVVGSFLAACHHDAHPVAPGEPIPAPPEVALGTMDADGDGRIAALSSWKTCANLDDDDKWEIDAWTDRMTEDYAAGKKVNPEPNAQHAIAAACHKAIGSVNAAHERCNNGPRPKR